MAAVLACGPGAVLSHRSAAAHWGIRQSERPVTDVSSPLRRGRNLEGIDAHRGGSLTEREITRLRGIPCTTPSRTLLDIATVIRTTALIRAIDQAERLRLFDGNELEALMERAIGHRGVPALRAALAEFPAEPAFTRSELERRFLDLCQRAGIPVPRVNAGVEAGGESFEVDFLWSERRLIVETDGYRFHSSPRAFEADRHREQVLAMAGWRVVRFSWRQVTEGPEAVETTLKVLLGR